MWTAILIVFGMVAVGAGVFVTMRIHRFSFMLRLAEKHKALSWLLSALPVASLSLFLLINVYALVIALLHLFVGFVICDFVAFIIRKAVKKDFNYNVQNIVALVITVVYLGAGWYFAHHVFETDYTVYTEKAVRDIRIVEIADLHLGITLDGEGFAEEMKRVQTVHPDVVVIAGDFVDDDSRMADLVVACRALGELETTYGVYFICGNHDDGYFAYRDFTSADLRRELTDNGVIILEDESVLLGDFYLVGRCDRSTSGRKQAADLTAELDPSKYILFVDHQPNDYDAEEKAGADLVLSGHTHGGHVFPAGLVGLMIGANDKVYGAETRGGTTFVVSSGISGWAIPFKTGCISEFVVIDVKTSE